MASISCNFSLSALPNINHTAVWLTGVGARNAIPSKKSKLPAQYWINLNVYSAWTTIKYWCFLCKHFKIWNWMIPSWLDKHHHHSVAAGEACENCLLVTWASALPAISCQSLIYVAPWCFKWMGWDWVGWVGSPAHVALPLWEGGPHCPLHENPCNFYLNFYVDFMLTLGNPMKPRWKRSSLLVFDLPSGDETCLRDAKTMPYARIPYSPQLWQQWRFMMSN